jgi:hypothetical protein
MEWLRKHLTWVLLVAVTASLVVAATVIGVRNAGHAPLTNGELADRLGDQDDLLPSTAVTCLFKKGTLRVGGTYNHRCLRTYYQGWCAPGTGETREIVFVRVRDREYRVIRTVAVIGSYVPCASVA